MTDGGRVKDLDHQVLGIFSKSYAKCYERWKRKDLLLVALQAMPKQVKLENVLENLIKSNAEFARRLGNKE